MAASRDDIVKEVLTWVGTPFHDCADVKGAGVDCGMLLVRVFCDLDILPLFDPRPYKPQWFQHRDEPLYLGWLAKYAHKVEQPGLGDVAMYNFGRHAAHAAIIVGPGAIVHAFKPAGRVIRDDMRHLESRLDSFWSVFK